MSEATKILHSKQIDLNEQESRKYHELSTHPCFAIYDVGRSNDGKLLVYIENTINYPKVSYYKYVIGTRGGVNRIIYSENKYSFDGGY